MLWIRHQVPIWVLLAFASNGQTIVVDLDMHDLREGDACRFRLSYIRHALVGEHKRAFIELCQRLLVHGFAPERSNPIADTGVANWEAESAVPADVMRPCDHSSQRGWD